jgi:hypothetical protein
LNTQYPTLNLQPTKDRNKLGYWIFSSKDLNLTAMAWRATVLPLASVASLGKAVAGYFHGSGHE